MIARGSSAIEQAINVIKGGGIVAFPTETYYGLAVDPENEGAVEKLYHTKGRDVRKPLLLIMESAQQLGLLTDKVPSQYRPLMARYWPGPLTLVFQARSTVLPLLTGMSGTIGVRVSPHPVAMALVKGLGRPITATSANISGHPPAASAADVRQIFGNMVDHVIDGGPATGGLCSTVLGLVDNKLTVFRQGQVSLPELID